MKNNNGTFEQLPHEVTFDEFEFGVCNKFGLEALEFFLNFNKSSGPGLYANLCTNHEIPEIVVFHDM